MSTEPNTYPSYYQICIIHFTDSGAVNFTQLFATEVTYVFGNKGFDNLVYDKMRNDVLLSVQSKIQKHQKACNIRMDFDNSITNTIFIHIYGTLYQKKQ